MDGDHTIERCDEVTEPRSTPCSTRSTTSASSLEGILLKPNMVISGQSAPSRPASRRWPRPPCACLRRAVPAAVPGIVFLSGGQSDELATAHLNAMNATAEPHPWEVSFSYGRALQAAAQKAWKGDAGRIAAGQKAFHHRARLNGLARSGRYAPEMEQVVA